MINGEDIIFVTQFIVCKENYLFFVNFSSDGGTQHQTEQERRVSLLLEQT